MPHRYWLTLLLSMWTARIEIAEPEYLDLQQAVDSLLHSVEAEENFEGLLDGYIEFESFLLREALQSLFWRDVDDVQDQARRISAGRKLSYFLSSARLYLDSIQRHACAILNDATDASVNHARSQESANSLSFRIMEALRNHAQHQALPIHGYVINRQWDIGREFFNFSFDPTLDLSQLIANPQLQERRRSRETIAEIRVMTGPTQMEIKPLARNYVECLSKIHQAFRLATSPTVDRHAELIREAKMRMSAAFPDRGPGCAIFATDETGKLIREPINMTNRLDDYLKFLHGRNRHLTDFSRRRVYY